MSALSDSLASWTYETVAFPVSETRVEWGHDSARHQGYRQRGAEIETTGQKPRQVSAKIPLRNGLRWSGARLYPETYRQLRDALKSAEGFLTHPTYGLMTVHVDSITETIDPTRPDGIDLDVTFTEQRAESQELEITLARSASPADAARAAAAEADKAATGISIVGASVLAEVDAVFTYLDEAPRSGADARSVLGDLAASLTDRVTDPAAAGVDGASWRDAVERTRAAVFARRAEYLAADDALTLTLSDTMSIARAAVLAYGDATRAGELAARNAIDDPLFVPAGTVLVL